MTNLEIDQRMTVLVKTERKITHEILTLIVRAEDQRLPAERGFKDTYDWLIHGHGYSGGAANRRIQAARLLRELPEIGHKVQSGLVNLTTLWQTQKAIRAQQKASKQKITLNEKRAAIQKIEGKTSDSAERALHSIFPDGIQEKVKVVRKRDGGIGIYIEFNADQTRELERSRELLSHTVPDGAWSQVIARLAHEFNQRKDPLRKPHLVATPQRITSAAEIRRVVIRRAGGTCDFVDSLTGRKCQSRFQLEIDHILPRAKGGSDDPSNLRCLCRRHNQLMAEVEFGREFMDQRRSNGEKRHLF